MLEVLNKKDEIQTAQSKFQEVMSRVANLFPKIEVGWQGESRVEEAMVSSKLGLWYVMRRLENRFWNVFGKADSKWSPSQLNNIIVEINSPFAGIRRSIGGAFARDRSGTVFLIHRGKIGGGRAGIGKTLFEEHYEGNWENVADGDRTSRVVVIGAIDEADFPQKVAKFALEVERIKKISAKGKVRST